MIRILEEAIERLRELPEAEQEEAAAMLLSVASKSDGVVALDDKTRAAIRRGQAQARRGEFVSDKDMSVFFKRHGVKRRAA
jgi:predicted transcriptional regulator